MKLPKPNEYKKTGHLNLFKDDIRREEFDNLKSIAIDRYQGISEQILDDEINTFLDRKLYELDKSGKTITRKRLVESFVHHANSNLACHNSVFLTKNEKSYGIYQTAQKKEDIRYKEVDSDIPYHQPIKAEKINETKNAINQHSDLKGFLLLKEKCNKELGRIATEEEFKEWLGW